jgi:hypothetical protein
MFYLLGTSPLVPVTIILIVAGIIIVGYVVHRIIISGVLRSTSPKRRKSTSPKKKR